MIEKIGNESSIGYHTHCWFVDRHVQIIVKRLGYDLDLKSSSKCTFCLRQQETGTLNPTCKLVKVTHLRAHCRGIAIASSPGIG